jgi:drug/metabolite transporter (DMT)-like permease
MAWLSIVLVVLGNVGYHLGQRAVPPGANPVVATLGAYLVAACTTIALLPLFARDQAFGAAVRSLNWSTVLVGVAIVGVELGFLLAYRSGWSLGTASLTANAAVAVALLAVGVLVFREPWSATRAMGVGCCILGLWLVNRG